MVGENLAQGAHENLLEKIFSVWEQDPSQAFNIKQLASRLRMNRRELKGALEVLYELGFLETTTWRKTRKEYRFNKYFYYRMIISHVHPILVKFNVKDAPEIQYSEDEWKEAMNPLISALFPPERLRDYIKEWHTYDSTHAFAHAVYTDAYMEKWSPELNDFEREYLALKLEDLIMYGAYKFGIEFVQAYFKEYLDAHQENKGISKAGNTP